MYMRTRSAGLVNVHCRVHRERGEREETERGERGKREREESKKVVKGRKIARGTILSLMYMCIYTYIILFLSATCRCDFHR